MRSALHRPEPTLRRPGASIDRETPPQAAAARLLAGEALVVADAWHTGLGALAALRAALPSAEQGAYAERQAARRAWRDAAARLLVPVRGHRIPLSGAPDIGLLKELYPELEKFGLSFVAAQDLYNADRIYTEGVPLAVLGHRLHPFYGTYVPTRVTHLELFATWLSQYSGARQRAVDVGTGCGVLALLLSRAGFAEVHATDLNPNAVESVRRELTRLSPPRNITVELGDLLGAGAQTADLIAFNPPWVEGEVEGLLDQSLIFEGDLFERFFAAAAARLRPEGRVALVFSNLITLVRPDRPHPIQAELARGRFRLVQTLRRRVQGAAQEGGGRRRTREQVEVWELALA